ncbi:Ger(x)C family spore germination protein [Paenibacillus protaetiae]|uniref:Ger(x)C family spore germination protein n=1 Tax=Paenibacillus protaetiae TaxID=2509456 RepID=UPI0013EA2B2C|nr:Ger(x)C family spore germination protein [Paenibacillus protaetiae]
MRNRLPRRVCIIAICICCSFITGGCWDYHDINHRSIPLIIGISKGKEKAYSVSLQIPIPAEKKLTVKVISSEGNTASEAVNNIRINVENYIDLLSVQLIVISQDLAQEGIKEELANTIRSRNFSPKALLAITNGDMEQLLNNSKQAVTHDVTTFYKFSNKRAGWTPKTAKTRLIDVFASTRSYTQDVMVPIIKPGRETVLDFDGSALLNKGTMVGKLNVDETLIVNVVSNRYYGADVEVLQNGSATIRSARMKWSSSMTGGRPVITGKLFLKASLTESRSGIARSEYKKELEQLFQSRLERVTNKLLQSGCDPIGFGNHFRSEIPFHKLANWRTDYYPKLQVNYRVHAEFDNLGSLVQ